MGAKIKMFSLPLALQLDRFYLVYRHKITARLTTGAVRILGRSVCASRYQKHRVVQ